MNATAVEARTHGIAPWVNPWKQRVERHAVDVAPIATQRTVRTVGGTALESAAPSWPKLILSHDRDGKPILVTAHPSPVATLENVTVQPAPAEIASDAIASSGTEETPRKFVSNPAYNPIDDAFVASRLYYDCAYGEQPSPPSLQ